MAPRTSLLLPAALVVLVASVIGGASATSAISPPPATVAPAALSATAGPAQSDLRVGVANLREGSLVRPRADARDGTDRTRAAARLLASGRAPDAVLLQEVLGSAGDVAASLNRRARARGLAARYAVATGTRSAYASGSCDGRRQGSFRVLRSSAILVNRRTVTRVQARGQVRTWGRWHRPAWRHTGRAGHGCSEQPWVRVSVRQPGRAARSAILGNVHAAPVGRDLKTRAVHVVQQALGRQHRARPGHRVVLGGDLNMNRCPTPLGAGEPRTCRPRVAHGRLLAAGYRDVVRSLHPDGPAGVTGVSHRIDFLYSKDTPRAAWWDRCYRAHFVKRWRCSAGRSVFASADVFRRCLIRSDHHGRPGGGCSPGQCRRFYSDHPVIVGTVR